MEQLQSAFEPYRHFDPMGWVGVFRFLPVWGGLVAMGVGVLMLLFGGRQLFRLVAGPLGALIATVWAAPLAQRLGFGANLRQIVLVSTIGLFGAGLVWPPAVIFFAFGVPAGLAGGQLAGNDWLLGFGPAFLVGGAIGVVLHRVLDPVPVGSASREQRTLLRRNFIDFIFQGYNLLAQNTAIENVELPMIYGVVFPKERHERAAHLLQRVGLGERMGHR